MLNLTTSIRFGVLPLALALSSVSQMDSTVAGRVIDAVSGRPLRGATIFWTTGAGGRGQPAAVTDASGLFSVAVSAGAVDLWASRSGYAAGGVGQQSATGPRAPIVVDAGARVTGITIRLWPDATISGRVLDEHGEPAPGTTVVLLAETWEFDTPGWQVSSAPVRTDDRGSFRMVNVTPGTYLVAVPGSGTLTSSNEREPPVDSYPTTFYPGVAAPVGATQVSVDSGEDVSLGDVVLMEPAGGASVHGQVVGALGSGRTEVELVPAERSMWTDLDIRRTGVSPTGSFSFGDVPYGHYVVRAGSMVGWNNVIFAAGVTSRIPVPPTYDRQVESSTTRSVWAEEDVNLEPGGGAAGTVLHLQPGLHIAGRLEFRGESPKPTSDSILLAAIVVVPTDGHQLRLVPTANPDGTGAFLTPEIPKGTYALRVEVPFAGWTARSVSVDGHIAADGRVDVRDSDVAGVVVTLTDQLTAIDGTVRDPKDTIVQNATVLVAPADHRLWSRFSIFPSLTRVVLTDSHGRYRCSDLLPGDYLLAATSGTFPSQWRNPEYLEARLATAVTVHTTAGSPVTKDLRVGG